MTHLTGTAETPKFEINTSRGFESFIRDEKLSFCFSTYQTGMIFLLGADRETGKLSIFNRTLERPMGMALGGKKMAVAAMTQIYTFVDSIEEGEGPGGYDAFYVPQISHFTGDMDVHDLAYSKSGELLFANTLFSCVAAVSETHSFRPVWTPPFISRLAPEDRCHLNGIALNGSGELAYATMVGETDIADGWRDNRVGGGVVYDCRTNEVVARDLSMPHSPRVHDDMLWLLNSGRGEFGRVNRESGRFEPIAFCPGYLRGLSLHGRHAFVGLSEPRENKTFAGLPLQERLDKENVRPRCGIYVIDIDTGDILHWLTISGMIHELYDVAVLADIVKPYMVGFKSDEIRRVISIED